MSAAERGDVSPAAPADVDDDLEFTAARKGSAEELLDADAHDPLDPMRHSAAHVMAEAVMDLFPGTRLGIGPAIEGGFYYDFEMARPLTPEDLGAIETRMAASVAADHPFVRREWDPDEGRAFLEAAGQPYKVEILDDLRAAAAQHGEPPPPVSTYQHGPFIDLCRGPHVESSGRLGPFKLLSVAGAYWRGSEERPMLQRIYGTVWSSQEELDLFLWRREEARKRDHRRLGVALDLFSFHDVSPGSAFWHPKGWTLYRTLEAAMRELQERRGYQEIYTPPLVHQKLWQQSGHWDHYREHMFLVEAEEQTFSLKPMNCPESTFIYKSRVRSYRELPLRLSEYGKLHRNELSGVLSGLTRVRHFVTDDAHIFVRPDQIGTEIEALLAEVREAYSWFGLEPTFTFGTRPEKALGDPALWQTAEALMREALDRSGMRYRVKEGDGAFYAPKIDIQIEDALGREWQTATVQADLVMLPERFDLTYVDESGEHVRPVAIHRAIYGSLERFIGVLIEHTGGALPFWCAPVQAVVIPIADRHAEAALELAVVLRAKGIRVEVDESSNRMQNKIRLAQEQKVPYMLVLGDREIEARTASPRTRAGEQQEPLAWEALAERLAEQTAARRPD
ncbi:MAG TPA: threonine--tRNA ligase [Candidatus Deferrimicrobium sp.]|nr:threonine--tRNA ligase [Candidatus Deferrimicrobium sp.]